MNSNPVPVSARNIENDTSLAGLLEEVMDKFLLERINDTLPAQVIQFDALTNRVEVKPLIQMIRTDGEKISRANIPSIPVFSLGSTQMQIRFNLQAGDLGWIKASDNDISLFLQTYQDEPPNSFRKHNFSDAVFYPDSMRGYNFTENMVISNPEGTIRIGFNDNSIDITAPNVNVNATNVDINATSTNIGIGGQPIARVGDNIQVNNVSLGGSVAFGTIISGSPNNTST